MKRVLLAVAAACAAHASLGQIGTSPWAGCYVVEGDRIQIRQEGNLHFVRAGTSGGQEVRFVMRSATADDLRRFEYPPHPIDGLVIDHAAVGSRVIEDIGGTLPRLGMYRVADANGRLGFLSYFPFAFGPAHKETCPAPKPPTPSPWVGCYAGRSPVVGEIRQDGDTLYIEAPMEGILPNALVFRPSSPADLDTFAAALRASAKGAKLEVLAGLSLYGVAQGTHYKAAEMKEGEPRMGYYRIRESGTEALYVFFLYTFEQVTKVPCPGKK
jgi:hypothetical protein